MIAICPLLQNRRFCLIFEIGGFVLFPESAVLSHFWNRRFCFIFGIGGFVPFPKLAILSHLKSAVLSRMIIGCGEHESPRHNRTPSKVQASSTFFQLQAAFLANKTSESIER